jgi:hypothetical protein
MEDDNFLFRGSDVDVTTATETVKTPEKLTS